MAAHSCIFVWRTPGQRRLAGYIVHGVTESQTQLSTHAGMHSLIEQYLFYPFYFRDEKTKT